MMIRFLAIFIFASSWLYGEEVLFTKNVPRTILALYKGEEAGTSLKHHPLHMFLEMPLNHHGLKVVYWDIDRGLPDLNKFPPLRGIVSWFYADYMKDPIAYLLWAVDRVKEGIKYLVIENLGAYRDEKKISVDKIYLNQFFDLLGLQHQDKWVQLDPTASFEFEDDRYVYFEQTWIDHPEGIDLLVVTDKKTTSFISLKMYDYKLPVVTVSPSGGIALEKYFIRIDPETYKARWIVNPFHYLGKVFDVADMAKPDVTTLNGRRIYFSHIDGDGWRSGCQIVGSTDKICAEVIYEKAIKAYPDLPVTVAPISADLDPSWEGSKRMQDVAKQLFALEHVEAGSHTQSHPFDWEYYNNPNPAKREAQHFTPDGKRLVQKIQGLSDVYTRPRAYFNKPFSLKEEIVGSLAYMKQFMPHHKKIKLLQWSGSCKPYVDALKMLEENKILNINGGDSRFDKNFPSYSSVCPTGRILEGYKQIYAVNSNENTYTGDWTERFYAFKFLKKTFMKTEMPMRVKGMNIYYHMYSAEKEASLAALLSNLEYVRTKEIAPIEASHYAEIGNGYYTARLIKTGELKWRIRNRGKLQTIRFDRASDKWIDFTNSEGVIGGRHYQGSLYVALDPADSTPLICLKSNNDFYRPPLGDRPYLIDSRWPLKNVKRKPQKVTFEGQGYGDAEMSWGGFKAGKYKLTLKSDKNTTHKEINVLENQILKFKLNINGLSPVQFDISLLS